MLTVGLELVAAGVMAAIITAAGARMCAVCRLPLGRDVGVAVHFLLGAGVLALLLTGVGLTGTLTRGVVVGVVGGMALAGRWRGWRWPALLPLAVVAAPLVLLGPVALAPPFFYDALVYHLGLPWQALLEHGWRPHPENLYAVMPPLAQCVALPGLALGLERMPAQLHLASFLAAGCSVSALARTLGAPRWAAASAGATVPLLPILVVMPAFPAAEGWGIAGATGAAALAVRRRLSPGGAALIAALAGIAVASRAQVAPLAAVLTLLALLRVRTWGQRLAAAVSLLVFAAPWWLKNLLLLGAPLAPLGWSVGGQEALWRDGRVAHALAATPAQAWQVVSSGVWPDAWYVLPLLLSSVLLLGWGRVPGRVWLAGVVMAGLAAWAGLAAVPRYLGATAALLLALSASLTGTRVGRLAFAMVVGATAAQGLLGTWTLVARLGGVRVIGREPAAVRERLVVNDPFPAFAAAAQLPVDARVLFVGEPRGFGFPRRFVAPSYYDVSPLAEAAEEADSPRDITEWMARQGFTHMLINWSELRRLVPGYPVAPWKTDRGKNTFLALPAELAPPAVAVSGVEIYSLAR